MHKGLRLAAFLLDCMLALLTVLALRLLLLFDGMEAGTPLLETQVLGIVLILLALRDVLLPVSPAKWLLCLQLTRPDGRSLSFAQRLLRAPLSLLPMALLPRRLQESLWWRVTTTLPSRTGLIARLVGTATAAALSLTWAIHTFQPSIGNPDAERLAHVLLQGDQQLRTTLGEPVQCEVGPVARRAERLQPGTARFRLRLRGTQGLQEMLVLARKVDGSWAVEELTEIQVVSFQRADSDLAERR